MAVEVNGGIFGRALKRSTWNKAGRQQRRIGRSADEPRHGCGSLGAGAGGPIRSGKSRIGLGCWCLGEPRLRHAAPRRMRPRPALWRVTDTLRCSSGLRDVASERGARHEKGLWMGIASGATRVKSGREVHTRFFVSCAVSGDTRGGVLGAPGPAPAHNETAPERSFSGAVGQRRGRKVPRGTRPGGSSGGLGGQQMSHSIAVALWAPGPAGPYSGRALERGAFGAAMHAVYLTRRVRRDRLAARDGYSPVLIRLAGRGF